jgi:hypothetical protein
LLSLVVPEWEPAPWGEIRCFAEPHPAAGGPTWP